jgi:hypothetical protein
MPTNGNNGTTSMVGWVYFAGILMILRGVSQAFLGISELVNKKYLFVSSDKLVLAQNNGTAWGWVHLALGVLILAAGFSLLHGSNWARILAIIFMGFSFLVNLAFIGVFPVWSIIAMIVDVLVIHALVVRGQEVV